MVAILFLIFLACLAGAATGLSAALAIWLRLIFGALDLLVQQAPRGLNLAFRLAYGLVVRLVRAARVLYRSTKRGGLWAAQHAYVWLFVWSYRLRRAYVASELRKRNAH